MKKYVVKVNGNEYEVEVDEIKSGSAPMATTRESVASTPQTAAPAASAPEPKPEPQPAKSAPAPAPAAVGSKVIDAPMPGTILKVAVKAGDTINKGDLLVVLEAMKMENDIVSPFDATVACVHTVVGASVNTGDPLVSFE